MSVMSVGLNAIFDDVRSPTMVQCWAKFSVALHGRGFSTCVKGGVTH